MTASERIRQARQRTQTTSEMRETDEQIIRDALASGQFPAGINRTPHNLFGGLSKRLVERAERHAREA